MSQSTLYKIDSDKGLRNFLVKLADIDLNLTEFSKAVDFSGISPEDVVDISIESGILNSETFMGKSIIAQKRNLLILLHFWIRFTAPACYARLYDPLKVLFCEAIKNKDIELVLYIAFFIRFYYGNLHPEQDAWKRLDNEIERPMSDFFVLYSKEHGIPPCIKKAGKNKTIRVGYIYQQLCPSSPVFVLLSLLKGHALKKNPDFEFYIYSYDYMEKVGDNKKTINAIESMGFKCISARQLGNFNDAYYSHFEKGMALRKQIIQDRIDILVTTGTQIGNFLVSSRVAPIQIYWSHGNPYWSVNNLDYRMVHSAKESITKDLYEGIEYFKFPNLMAIELLNQSLSPQEISEIRQKFPADKILLGVFGNLPKLNHPDYLFAVSEILNRNNETIFLICGYGDKEAIKMYFERSGCSDRVYFEGHVNPHIYGHVIDIALDSFPVPMGVASLEYYAKGKPMVSLKVSLDEINEFRVKDVLASSIEEYIQIAGKLIKDRDFKDEIGKRCQKFIERRLDCQRAANELEKLYKNLIEGTGQAC